MQRIPHGRCQDIPRHMQATTIQPMKPKREPLAWGLEECSTPSFGRANVYSDGIVCGRCRYRVHTGLDPWTITSRQARIRETPKGASRCRCTLTTVKLGRALARSGRLSPYRAAATFSNRSMLRHLLSPEVITRSRYLVQRHLDDVARSARRGTHDTMCEGEVRVYMQSSAGAANATMTISTCAARGSLGGTLGDDSRTPGRYKVPRTRCGLA
jgi:hypothetical protein